MQKHSDSRDKNLFSTEAKHKDKAGTIPKLMDYWFKGSGQVSHKQIFSLSTV